MIYFVGAGPGAVDLITVRGQRLLQAAGMVVYAGSLVNPALLDSCPENCEILDSAGMTLEEVIRAMAGSKASVIVRLHTGDPSIYGAIREQMDALSQLGIDYEVVPGVSSFCAAAASVKAEYTLPEVSQTVIISRMAGRTAVPERESIRSLAAHGASMVIFLSASMMSALCQELILGGYARSTPAALVYKASWPVEKILRGTLETIPALAEAAGINKTALLLVGHFLGDEYAYSKLYDPGFSHGFRAAKS